MTEPVPVILCSTLHGGVDTDILFRFLLYLPPAFFFFLGGVYTEEDAMPSFSLCVMWPLKKVAQTLHFLISPPP